MSRQKLLVFANGRLIRICILPQTLHERVVVRRRHRIIRIALAADIQIERNTVFHATNVTHTRRDVQRAIHRKGTIIHNIRIQFLGKLPTGITIERRRASRSRNRLASLCNLLLVRIGPHVIRKRVVHRIAPRTVATWTRP